MKQEKLGFLLFRAFHTHWRVSNTRFWKQGITPGQPRILGYLSQHDGCIQRELAEHCRYQAASISGVLASMEREGLIRREQSRTDRRALHVYVTEKGRSTQAFCQGVLEELDEAAFRGFSPRERETAMELLGRIGENLAELVDENAPDIPPPRSEI